MKWCRGIPALALSAGLSMAALCAALPAPTARADRELLARLARETGVVTRPPRPSVQEYVGLVVRRILERLFGWLHLPGPGSEAVFAALYLLAQILAWAIVAGAAVGLLLLLVRRVRRAGRSREDAGGDDDLLVASRPRVEHGELWRRFSTAIEAGDLDTALQALWLWAGERLAGEALDASWTSTELLRHTGRTDLRPVFTRLDTWRYGPAPPPAQEVLGLAHRLQEATA